MSEALSPPTKPSTATTQSRAAHPAEIVRTAAAPWRAFVAFMVQVVRGRRQRQRAQVLAAAQQADATECARAFGRLLNVHFD